MFSTACVIIDFKLCVVLARTIIMTDKTIMESLHNYLPKDLVNIIEEYFKDITNYDNVTCELNKYQKDYIWNILNPHSRVSKEQWTFADFVYEVLFWEEERRVLNS